MAQSLTFGCINISGLKNNTKRAAVYAWLDSLNLDVIFLQETHCHLRKEEKIWSREWGAQSYWSKGTSRSRGVAILFNRSRKYEIENVSIDTNGRYIHCNITADNNSYKIINIYAPNDAYDRVRFINGIDAWIDSEEEVIIGGDFNCALDTIKDRKNCTGSRDLGQIDLNRLMTHYDLEDVWRRRFPDELKYSWNRGDKFSRIDYWLVSKSLDSQIENENYLPCVFSDHSLVTFRLKTSTITRGRGFWKLNSAVAESELFKKAFRSMWDDWLQNMVKYKNLNTWWDLGKVKIRDLATWCSIKLKQDKMKHIKYLETILEQTDENTDKVVVNNIRFRLRELYGEVGKGAEVRSRVQWFQEGEKPTRYFHNIEKCKGKSKTWDKIINNSGEIVTGTDDIQKVQMDYFKTLYTSQSHNIDSELQDKFCNVIDSRLSEESQNLLDKELNVDELYNSLRYMKNNKSPGPDGITVEFYKAFWKELKDPLLKVYNNSFDIEEMSYTQYLAIIVLLYKKGVRESVKNWRPISLINVDSKLLSKVFATRVKKILPEIIHTDQRGCIQGRFIGQNIRLIEDIVHEMDDDKIILMLDQEKAFDRVEWTWLFKVLNRFSFSENFIKWVKLMYKNMKSSVLTNGYPSEYFKITRGIRQGDSLSALLYVIQAEPLSQYLRKSSEINGIVIEDHEEDTSHIVKGCQYVDDAITVLNSVQEIETCFKIIDEYGKASGSSLNKLKTTGLSNKARTWDHNGVNISRGPEISLGIPVGKGTDLDQFWYTKIEKVKQKLNVWATHNLSLTGKIYVIKSIALSQILYFLEMTMVDKKHLESINSIVWNFLWDGKHKSITKNICTLPKVMGGLGLPNIEILVKVRRIKMLMGIIRNKDIWNLIARKHICMLDRVYGKLPWFSLCVNDSGEDILQSAMPKFYQECILAYQELCRKGREECIWDRLLWCNDRIKHNNRSLRFKHWAKSNIKWLSDLGEGGMDFARKEDLKNRLNHKAGFIFEYKKLEIATKNIPGDLYNIPSEMPESYNEVANNICNTRFKVMQGNIKTLIELTSHDIYKILLSAENIKVTSKEYWIRKFPNEVIDFNLWFSRLFKSKLCDRKSMDYNWKIFHGQVNTEKKLRAMGLSNGICRICDQTIEDIVHLFDCDPTRNVWLVIETKLHIFNPNVTQLTDFNKVVGILSTEPLSEESNMIVSQARWMMWKSRCKNKFEDSADKHRNLLSFVMAGIRNHLHILIKVVKGKQLDTIKTLQEIFKN